MTDEWQIVIDKLKEALRSSSANHGGCPIPYCPGEPCRSIVAIILQLQRRTTEEVKVP